MLSSLTISSSIQAASEHAALSPAIDRVSQQVLLNMHLNGWNPNARFRGITTGGLFVNWNMLDPRQTNNLGSGAQNPVGCDVTPLPPNCPNPQTVQDPQTALYYLEDLAEYTVLHPQDHSYDADLRRMTGLVIYEFANYNLPKGWIYFYLLRAGQLLHNPILLNESYQVAYNYYAHWYNPQVGLIYNPAHASSGTYTTEHSLLAGAALINAGTRWHQPALVQAGQSTLDHTLTAAYNPSYNLIAHDMTVTSDGTQQIANSQAKPDAQGSIAEALLDAYTQTSNPRYLNTARQILQSLLVTSELWDQANGGLSFALNMSTGSINRAYKETRAQAHVLIALTRYNRVLQLLGQAPQFLEKEQQLISLLTDKFYQSTYHGYFYRVTPTFGPYVTSSGLVETYFTSESMGIALDAIQQTEFPSIPS
ncbi:MAG: hypothetical protein H0U76_15615 [Ktedonobacteraceae bacterium]|nr:hypothetical protein [Ktedonobacteraceae bacterium]